MGIAHQDPEIVLKGHRIKPGVNSQDAELARFHAKARQMGFCHLNPVEKRLIELLRFTNYHGRNVVVEVAQTMRKSHPWINGNHPGNTSTTYPDNGCFFVLAEDR